MVDRLPLTAIKKVLVKLRKQYFSISRPSATGLKLYTSHDDLEASLQEAHFHDVAKYSYKYEGEVLNMSRPEGVLGTKDGDDLDPEFQMELHGRSFDLEDDEAIYFYGHYEVSRFQHWRDHVEETYIVWADGRDMFKQILLEAGIEFEELHEANADIID